MGRSRRQQRAGPAFRARACSKTGDRLHFVRQRPSLRRVVVVIVALIVFAVLSGAAFAFLLSDQVLVGNAFILLGLLEGVLLWLADRRGLIG